jgi:hypothetical protein
VRARACVIAALVVPWLGLAAPAAAQSAGIVADRFVPAVGPLTLLAGEGAEVTAKARLSWGLSLSLIRDPIRLQTQYVNALVSVPVSQQLALDFAMEAGIWKRFAVAIGVPAVLQASGDRLAVAGDPRPLSAPVGGDLRLRVKVAFIGDPSRRGLHLGALLQLTVPLNGKDDFAAMETVTVEPRLLADVRLGRLVLVAALGVRFQNERKLFLTTFGDELTWLGGAGLRVVEHGRFAGSLVAEVGGFVGPSPGTRPIEVRGAARLEYGAFALDLGAGAGVVHEVGAPSWRVLAVLRHSFDVLP